MMKSTHPRYAIQKCIVSFSHNRYPSRKKADKTSIAKAQREIAAGKKGISHLILRAEDDAIDQLKFLFLIHGIPVMCYALANLLQSSLKEIVVVGSAEVERVLEVYLETIGNNGKKVSFVREDPDNLSLLNTLILGKSRLDIGPDEMVLFQPGDLPFMYDIEKILQDPDNEHYNIILWLNSRQSMFPHFNEDPESEFVQRNYHYRGILEEENELHEVKEPNVYPINLSAVESDIIEYLHSSRKDGNILNAGIKKLLGVPGRILRLVPVVLYHLLHFRSDLKKFRAEDKYQFGMHKDNFHRGTSILLDTACITKFHNDPAFVSDVDALEDWEDFESLTDYAREQYGDEGLSRIHPAGRDLIRFREQGMPRLQKEIPMFRNFPSYINQVYRDLQMGYVPYPHEEHYEIPNRRSARVERAFQWYNRVCQGIKGKTNKAGNAV